MAGVTVTLGRWVTRSNRIVDIDQKKTVKEQRGLESVDVTIFSGVMKKADGKTEDGRYDWTAAGNFRNPQGVTNTHDLVRCLHSVEAPKEDRTGEIAEQPREIVYSEPRTNDARLKGLVFESIAHASFEMTIDLAFNGTDQFPPITSLATFDLAAAHEAYPELRAEWESHVRHTLARLLQLADRAKQSAA